MLRRMLGAASQGRILTAKNTGWLTAAVGIVQPIAPVGQLSWSNPDNCRVSDNAYATCDYSIFGEDISPSIMLIAAKFSANLPSYAVITGVSGRIERKSSADFGLDFCKDSAVNLVRGVAGPTFYDTIGNSKADTVTHWPTSDAFKTYGSSVDLWNAALTAAIINTDYFGLSVTATLSATSNVTASVDCMQIMIDYLG